MDYLSQSVIDYVKRRNTDYAIMINGVWGSGKTYYWNHVLKKEIENINIGETKYKVIYVSLYGVNSLDEISKSLFVQVFSGKHDFLKQLASNKIGNAIPEVGKLIMNSAGLFGLSLGENEIDLSKFTSFDKTVLCFDDLERVNIEVSTVLGFINNLVEHDYIKTIIISNEKEIAEKIIRLNYELKALTAVTLLEKTKTLDKEKDAITSKKEAKKSSSELINDIINDTFDKINEYKRIKEKLIGKTFMYSPNYEDILDNLIKHYEYNSLFYKLISENKQLIQDIFYISETWNLRILKHSLSDYEVIFDEVRKIYPHIDKTLLLKFLKLTLSLSFEIKSGNIRPEIFSKLNSDSDYTSQIYGYALLQSKEEPIVEFDDKYYREIPHSEHIFFKFIEIYVNTGFFKHEVMINEIDELLRMEGGKNKPSYQKLLYNPFWELSDEEFQIALADTFNTAKNGDLHHVCYFRGFVTFYQLDKIGLLTPEMKEYNKVFLDGLELTRERYSDEEDLSMEFNFPSDSELKDNEDLNTIILKIIEINAECKDKRMKREIEKLFELLSEGVRIFKKEVDEHYYSVPIFSYYDMDKLFKYLISFRNDELVNFRNFIKNRYLPIESLKKDQVSFNKLKKALQEYIQEKPYTLKLALMSELIKTLNEICRIPSQEK